MNQISKIDIYRTANQLIKKYGEHALAAAQEKELFFMEKEDYAGASTWHNIGDAITWMQIDPELSGETCH